MNEGALGVVKCARIENGHNKSQRNRTTMKMPPIDSADAGEFCNVKIKEVGGLERRREGLSGKRVRSAAETTSCQLARSEKRLLSIAFQIPGIERRHWPLRTKGLGRNGRSQISMNLNNKRR